MILVLDNYDSFTYNLVQFLARLDPDVRVVRNDAATADALLALGPSRIVISPGPGRPEDAGGSGCRSGFRRAARLALTLSVLVRLQAQGVAEFTDGFC